MLETMVELEYIKDLSFKILHNFDGHFNNKTIEPRT